MGMPPPPFTPKDLEEERDDLLDLHDDLTEELRGLKSEIADVNDDIRDLRRIPRRLAWRRVLEGTTVILAGGLLGLISVIVTPGPPVPLFDAPVYPAPAPVTSPFTEVDIENGLVITDGAFRSDNVFFKTGGQQIGYVDPHGVFHLTTLGTVGVYWQDDAINRPKVQEIPMTPGSVTTVLPFLVY